MGYRGAPRRGRRLPVLQTFPELQVLHDKYTWSLPHQELKRALRGLTIWSRSHWPLTPSLTLVPPCHPGRTGASLPAPFFQGSPSHCLDSVLRAVPTMPRSARLLPGWGQGRSATRTPRPSPRAARTCPYPRKATTLLHNSPTSSPAPPPGNNKVSLVEVASAGSREEPARKE